MTANPRDALDQVHTAVKDVLAGYDTLLQRAEPDIRPTVQEFATMHERHASELANRLGQMGDAPDGDASIRGSVNKAAVTIRDWVSTLDENALSFVRDGEERLANIYDDALQDWSPDQDLETSGILNRQWKEVTTMTERLPAA